VTERRRKGAQEQEEGERGEDLKEKYYLKRSTEKCGKMI
jgi:hypothetical protein